MYCKKHPGREAIYVCRNCGEAMCIDCTVALNEKNYCKECLESIIAMNGTQQRTAGREVTYTRRKSKFFTMMFGLIPGGGHLYIGLINKGMTLMATFFTAIFTAVFMSEMLGLHWFPEFFIPVVSILSVSYSIFDARFLAGEMNDGKTVTDSQGIRIYMDYEQIRSVFVSNKKIVAYSLIVMGTIGTLNIAIQALKDVLWKLFHFSFPYYLSLPRFIVPIAMVLAGLYLLGRGKRQESF